jgi:hypothetical protein
MKRLRLLTALIAAFSLVGAVAAAGASALPEFTGPFPKPFGAKSGKTILETVGKAKLECIADKAKGEILTGTMGTASFVFTGCKLVLPAGAAPCNSAGASPGEIVTPPLPLTLGYIAHTPLKTVVGLEVGHSDAPLVMFECGAAKATVIGSFIGKITPIKKVVPAAPAGHFTLAFTQLAGKQKPKHFEGLPPDVFEASFGGPFEEAGFSSKETVGFPLGPVEIVA